MERYKLKCKYCGNEMVLYDGGYDANGYYINYYWLCEKCGASAVEKGRDGKRVTVEWVEEEEENAEEVASKDARTGGGLRSPWEEEK